MLEKDLPFSTMLVELDCLLDTRISILSELDDNKFQEVLKMYHSRDIDSFPYYGFNRFKEKYENRDKSLLKNSLVTPILGLIVEFVNKTLLQILNTPYHHKPKIVINIYPYVLEEEEINNIISIIVVKTNGRCDVEIVNKSLKELTVGYVKNNLSIMVMYDCYKWIEFHSVNKAFEQITCPEVNLFSPAIYFKEKQPNLQLIEEPFKSMEEIAKPLIGLKLFPVSLFSFMMPIIDKKENTTT